MDIDTKSVLSRKASFSYISARRALLFCFDLPYLCLPISTLTHYFLLRFVCRETDTKPVFRKEVSYGLSNMIRAGKAGKRVWDQQGIVTPGTPPVQQVLRYACV